MEPLFLCICAKKKASYLDIITKVWKSVENQLTKIGNRYKINNIIKLINKVLNKVKLIKGGT